MRTKFSWADLIVGLVWLTPLAYLARVYPSLPPRVPMHYSGNGEANGFGSPAMLRTVVLTTTLIALGIFLLIRFLPLIDPKQKVRYSQAALVKIGYAVVAFLSALMVFQIYSASAGHLTFPVRWLYPLLGLFFAFLGNLFNNLKPNYFVGIRTPWTLESEVVWKKTHQLGGRVWLAGGLIIAVLTWLLPASAAETAFFIGSVVIVLIPVIYSYICFRQLQK